MDSRKARKHVDTFLGMAALLLVIAAMSSGPVSAHTGDDGFHHHDGWMDTHGWVGDGLWFLWPLLGIAITLAIAYLIFTRRSDGTGATDDALELLRQRYARGDIDSEEFQSRRSKLRQERE